MWNVYVLLSEHTGRHYVGMSQDVQKRLQMHNAGLNRSTKAYRPRKIVYEENIGDSLHAREREKYLKSGVGREYIKKLLYENNKDI